MNGFTNQQIEALRAPLAREHVRSRSQAGRTLSYVEGWHVLAEANRIFGFDGWDRETVDCHCVSEKAAKLGSNQDRDGWRVAYVGKVRVTVRAGDRVIVREGTGYGSGIDADIGSAHESAAKECETDATKRALMSFGSPMGLALYDKTQAEVEPVSRPQDAQKPAPTAQRPQDHPQWSKANAAFIRIEAELKNATMPAERDSIIGNSRADLEVIKTVDVRGYDALIRLSNKLNAEQFGATG